MTEEKKLEIKSELLRHLEKAEKMRGEGHPSSHSKVIFLKEDIRTLEYHDRTPNLDHWRAWLGNN